MSVNFSIFNPQSYKCLREGSGVENVFNLHFSQLISPLHEMLKLGRVTKVKVFFLVLGYVFNIDLCESSAAILEKGLYNNI